MNRISRLPSVIRLGTVAIAFVLLLTAKSTATTITVLNTNDTGTGSLRQAITMAIAGDGIVFDPSVTNTITLTSGELLIGRSISIVGPGAKLLAVGAVGGHAASRIFHITNAVVSISGLTITNGLATGTNSYGSASGGPGFGGGVYNQSNLVLSACSLISNRAIGGTGGTNNPASPGGFGLGGAIYNLGVLILTNCTCSGNSASGGQGGAGTASYSTGGSAYGGAICSYGTITIANCTFVNNYSSGGEGGTCPEFSSAGTGGSSYGGAVYNAGHMPALTACTLSGNHVSGGQGGANYSGVGSGGTGGSCYGGGLASEGATPGSAGNTIIAGNAAYGGLGGLGTTPGANGTGNDPDVDGSLTSAGHNLIGKTDGSSGWISNDLTGTSATPLDPNLGPLTDNGGPTLTMALLTGSAAIDRGYSFGLTTDQRGQPRPLPGSSSLNGGDGSDIGAYEVQTDSVGDGIRDAWRAHYFGGNGTTSNYLSCATCNPDSDGLNNLQEFSSGFSPTNNAAWLHILSIAKSGYDVNVGYLGANGDNTWSPGVTSRTNILEVVTNSALGGAFPSSPLYAAKQTNILSGGNGLGIVTNMTDFGGATNGLSRYYRVRLVP